MTSEKKKAVALAGVTAFDTTVHSQNYIAAPGFVQTMSSREIAELTGSTHDNVLKTVRGLVEKGVVSGNETPYIHPQNGQVYAHFELSYRDTLVVVSGYSVELRARIIDRWQELETTGIPVVSTPKTFAAALRLAAEQQERIESQAAQLIEHEPKVVFADAVADSSALCYLSVFAKAINQGPNRLFRKLRADKVLMDSNLPFQKYVDRGYFKVVERKPWTDSKGNEHPTFTTMVTGTGQAWLAQRYGGTTDGAEGI